MKIRNWRRRLYATLAALGMAPIGAHAADLNTNLVINPGFENVDLFSVSFYNAPLILDWEGLQGFAYSHDLSGASVPDFANGGPLASGGHWYFTPGNNTNESKLDALKQDIDVSGGATGQAIIDGSATFSLSAFFSTYSTQPDRAFIEVEFLDGAGAPLGSAMISTPAGPALTTWTQFSASGSIPVGTATVRMFSWGEIGQPGSADGYTDNISFIIAALQAADFDEDGTVDGDDLTRWRMNFGTAGNATHMQGDADEDLDVDGADFLIWQRQLSSPLVSAVPEPGSLAVVGGATWLAAWRRRSRK